MIVRPNKYNSLSIPGFEPQYEVTRGGLGTIWKYRSKDLAKLDENLFNKTARIGNIVIKFPNKDTYGDYGELNDLVKNLFETEAGLLEDLAPHPYLPPLKQFGYGTKTKKLENNREEEIELPYIMMPFIPGVDFEQIIENINNDGIQLPNSYITKIIKTLFGTVLDIHERGYLHNDLKDKNWFLNTKHKNYKTPTLLDLGLSLEIGSTIPKEIGTIGSIFTSSPETQSLTRDPLTEKSDSYPLGLMLYKLVAQEDPIYKGVRIYFGEKPESLMRNTKEAKKRRGELGVDERILELKTKRKLGSYKLINFNEIERNRKEKINKKHKEIINGSIKENPKDRISLEEALKIFDEIPEGKKEKEEIKQIENLIDRRYTNFSIAKSAEARRRETKEAQSFVEHMGEDEE